ncbi:hypothetical protein AURDEDRAFT_111742 [Auricularia subglabra TFB-10046 SS5]|nr:hypothetical protein AURDEDRAFT_111742 [Auricularia subglabra TFB-10046 SS5]
MPKAAADSESSTRPTRKAKATSDKPAGEKKTRAPSAYALFVKEQMPIWKANNPEKKHTAAMKEIAALWADSDKNPNKGKAKGEKENAPKKPVGRPKKKAAPVASESEPEAAEGSGGDDE